MPSLRPIPYRKFEKFLEFVGCHFNRKQGSHIIYKKIGLPRPVVFRPLKDLSIIEIKTNLKTLNISVEEYLKILENL